ncbi:low affinity immunoglobulin epsilon Fc receptor [Anabrus simplex]|uniref:low affinity immunoglobulin epsilon Fc receptor n=1 Tax=Anabrus simplex TaxID=316456 RepID=UPI0034DD2485
MMVRSTTWRAAGLILGLVLVLVAAQTKSQQFRGHKSETSEIARQNHITQQILAQYLQRRLFPHLTTSTTTTARTDIQEDEEPEPESEEETDLGRPPEDVYRTTENLESVESEHVDNVYLTSQGECTNCVDDSVGLAGNRWTMPLLKLGEKRYYLGIFFKANWYRAAQYCRYHGMHLASINSQEENDKLEKHIRDFGLGHEHFWTSGTDQAEEGTFFWMATGRPITFTNWNTGEPNNFRYENGEEEHCLELWNRDGKGLKWNDTPCSFETFFVCEVP